MTQPISATDLPSLRVAHSLVNVYRRIQAAGPRTKAFTIADAEFKGQLDILDRLRLINTPAAGYMAVMDAVKAAGPRPEMNFAGSNEQMYAWDRTTAELLRGILGLTSLDLSPKS